MNFMDKDAALSFVYECLLGDTSIYVKLRMGEGLEEVRFNKLKEAVRFLVDYYAHQEEVLKRLALCMVDIYAAFSFREGFYNDSATTRIENSGVELQELATELLMLRSQFVQCVVHGFESAQIKLRFEAKMADA